MKHASPTPESLGRRSVLMRIAALRGGIAAESYMPEGLSNRFERPPRDCVPVAWPAAGLGAAPDAAVADVVAAAGAAPFAVCWARL